MSSRHKTRQSTNGGNDCAVRDGSDGSNAGGSSNTNDDNRDDIMDVLILIAPDKSNSDYDGYSMNCDKLLIVVVIIFVM